MIGAIIGDIIGSAYLNDSVKTKEFPLFTNKSHITHQSIMALVVTKALLENRKNEIVQDMKQFGTIYQNVVYSPKLKSWFLDPQAKTIDFDDSTLINVACAIAWIYDTEEEIHEAVNRLLSKFILNEKIMKHIHLLVHCIYLALIFFPKDDIKKYLIKEKIDFEHDLLGQAFEAFMQGNTFEECIRNAVLIGHDEPLLAMITGSLAEAYYDAPTLFEVQAKARLPVPLIQIVDQYFKKIGHSDPFIVFNKQIKKAINDYKDTNQQEDLYKTLETIRYVMNNNGFFMVSSARINKDGKVVIVSNMVKDSKGKQFCVAFTSPDEINKQKDSVLQFTPIHAFLNQILKNPNIDGLIINPWTDKFILWKQWMKNMQEINDQTRRKVDA